MATVISRLATALLGGCLAFASATAGAALAWFSDDNGVLQASDQRSRRVAVVTGIQGLAATRDGGAWAISEHRVWRFASDGSTRVEIDLTQPGYGRAERLAVDPYDDSAWIGTDARLLLHIPHAGEVTQGISFDEGLAQFVIALDRTIWALADGRLAGWNDAAGAISCSDSAVPPARRAAARPSARNMSDFKAIH
jgi:hypothetical protein